MEKFKSFDKTNCQSLRSLLVQATEELETKYGIKFNFGNMRYTPNDVKVDLKVFIAKPGDANTNPWELEARNRVKSHGWKFGITESVLGLKIIVGNLGKCTVVGCSDRVKKNPILCSTPRGRYVWVPTSNLRNIAK